MEKSEKKQSVTLQELVEKSGIAYNYLSQIRLAVLRGKNPQGKRRKQCDTLLASMELGWADIITRHSAYINHDVSKHTHDCTKKGIKNEVTWCCPDGSTVTFTFVVQPS